MLVGTIVRHGACGGRSKSGQAGHAFAPPSTPVTGNAAGRRMTYSPAFYDLFFKYWSVSAWIGLPHTAARCISLIKTVQSASHRGIIIGSRDCRGDFNVWMHFAGARWVARCFRDLTVPDPVIPNANGESFAAVARRDLPRFAPLAAIMSTINAQLLQSSATIIKDSISTCAPINRCKMRSG